ncbi:LRIF1 factor, partial [Serilophus lunatus]|nr:LRIF1 factor [Serilophus lunatus]
VYRVLQTTAPDGKNLLKLLPLPKFPGSFPPPAQAAAVPPSPAGTIPSPSQFGNPAAPPPPGPGQLLPGGTLDRPGGAEGEEDSVPGGPMAGIPVSGPAFMVVSTQSLPGPGRCPALPAGHHLQIPADAEVRAVPASLLPAAIQHKILAAAATPPGAQGSKTPTVIYVSPVNTSSPEIPKQFQPLCPQSSPEGPKALLLRATPPGSAPGSDGAQRRQPPLKWVVQETPSLSAPCLIPVKSSNNVASKILKSLSDSKDVEVASAHLLPPCPGGKQPRLAPLRDNALVMYNGKVYLLAKRGSDLLPAPAAPLPEDSLEKEPPEPVGAPAVTRLPSKAVLSQSQGVVLAQSCQDSPAAWKRDSQSLGTPSAEQEGPSGTQSISSQGDIPGTRGSVWKSGSSQCGQEGAPREDWPKGLMDFAASAFQLQQEPLDSLGKGAPGKAQELPHWRQYWELRKKFGLSREERVCLRRIPVIQEDPEEREHYWERTEDPGSSLDVEMGSPQECGAEEKVPAGPAEERSRKRQSQSPPGCAKRGRNCPGPEVGTPSATIPGHSPPPEPGSPGGSPQETEPQPLGGDPSLLEGSFRDDAFLAAPPDLDETIRDEKVKRLKQLLREREAALEELRRGMLQS